MKQRSFDVLGNIAIVNFSDNSKLNEKKKFANKLLKEQNSIKTVLEKYGKIKGRLRKISTRYIAGEKTKEVLYKENGCVFRFNIDNTYFSPRLSNERKEISSLIKKNENVLVMFAGVAPFSIVIAKNSKAKKVISNEINREANKYAKLNIELNKLKGKVELFEGDIKRISKKFKEKFDVIVMPRP
ncbi:SAM-dependent methyltransferase, partial [Candidatus Pacearchaeota archaeon]|nr:SAM-dependent methyltransferase [Candidatus Pacearchaeota archaeon]